jgi:hypothetical protein
MPMIRWNRRLSACAGRAKQWRCKRCWFILGCALGGVLRRHSGITDRGFFLAKPGLAVAIIRQNLCLVRRTVKRYQRPTGLAPIDPPHSLRSGLLFVSTDYSCLAKLGGPSRDRREPARL